MRLARLSTGVLVASVLALAAASGSALAHTSTNTISAPLDGAEIVVDSLPTTVMVQGTITHSPGNINGQVICVRLDGSSNTCLPALGGLGNTQAYNYSVPVQIGTAGAHTLQGINANSEGDHAGASELTGITIVLTSYTCDDRAPPAHANHYLNFLNPPQQYASYRGQVISIIASYHANGKYGTCTFDYAAVEADVRELFAQLGFTLP